MEPESVVDALVQYSPKLLVALNYQYGIRARFFCCSCCGKSGRAAAYYHYIVIFHLRPLTQLSLTPFVRHITIFDSPPLFVISVRESPVSLQMISITLGLQKPA